MSSLAILFGVFAACLVIGVPIVFALCASALVLLSALGLLSPELIVQRIFAGIDSFPMLAIPFFMIAGALMETGGISRRLVDFSNYLVGWIAGGLAHVAVVASLIFAGISGSAVADTTAIGSGLIPMMKKRGFDPAFAGSVVAAAGVIGPIIPPSIPMVLYGVSAGVSIGALFMGGVVPGLIMALGLMVLIYVKARRGSYPREAERLGFRGLVRAFWHALPALLMPAIIIGGILLGVFTATEAAVVASAYALFAGLVIYRELRLRDLPQVLFRAGTSTAMILVIVGVANLVGYVLAVEQIPLALADWFSDNVANAALVLLLINLMLLVVGCFLDGGSAIIIFTPVLLPVVQQFGIDPLFFGVMMTINLMIGTITPPVGLSLYVASDIAGVQIGRISRAVLPFLLLEIGVLLLVTYVPELTLALPEAVMR